MASKRWRFAASRRSAGYSQEQLAEQLGVERSTVTRWEAGETTPQPWVRPKLAKLLTVSGEQLDGLLAEAETAAAVSSHDVTAAVTSTEPVTVLEQVERLRQGLHETISEHALSRASLDDWEQTVSQHGNATRDRPPVAMLDDLTADLAELQQALTRCRSSTALRRLTRVTAHLAGLMCLMLIKLGSRPAFRRWARTARTAADEAGDPLTASWVRAQEAYGCFYSGNLTDAVVVAQHAQTLAGHTPCVGIALAAALEARAQAALGKTQETLEAIARAEAVLAALDDESVTVSAFGYNEAQLRFHEGNALTHLHDTTAAWSSQQRALELCPANDYLDRTLTQLDRVACLAHDGDASGAADYAIQALVPLTEDQRRGLITLRAHEAVATLPSGQRALPAVRDLHDLLMLTSGTKENEGWW